MAGLQLTHRPEISINKKQIMGVVIIRQVVGFILYLGGVLMLIALDGCAKRRSQSSLSTSNDSSRLWTHTIQKVNSDTYFRDLRLQKDSLSAIYLYKRKFIIDARIESGAYTMDIESFYLNDTLARSETGDSILHLVVTAQKLRFMYNNDTLKSFFLPIESIAKYNRRGVRIRMLNASIWKLHILSGKSSDLFAVNGAGFCSGDKCPEFIGLYLMNGKPLFQGYLGTGSTKKIQTILSTYGISNFAFNSKLSSVRIDVF